MENIISRLFGNINKKTKEIKPDQDRTARALKSITEDGSSTGINPALIAENSELLDAVIKNLFPEGFESLCTDDISIDAAIALTYVMGRGFEEANLTEDEKRKIREKIRKGFQDIIESDKYLRTKAGVIIHFWYLTMDPDGGYCVKFLDTEIVAYLLELIDETDEKSVECASDSLYNIWKAVEGDATEEFIKFLIEQQDRRGEKSKQLIARILTKALNSKTCESLVTDVLKKNINEGGKLAIVALENMSDDTMIRLRSFLLDVLVENAKRKDGKDEVVRIIIELLGKVLVKEDKYYQVVYDMATDPEIDFTPVQNSARKIVGGLTGLW